jgi:hypothetical protein
MTTLNADYWIYTELSNDSHLATYLDDRIYIDLAPQNTQYPLAIITFVSGNQVSNVSAERIMDNELWQVAVWDKQSSYVSIGTIADRIKTVLHKESGTGVIGAVYESERRLAVQEGDIAYKAIILEFRVYTQ